MYINQRNLTRGQDIFAIFALIPALAALPGGAKAAQATGTVVLNITGTLQTASPPSSTTILTCSGTAFLAPTVTETTTLGAVSAAHLLMAGGQSGSTQATIANPTAFSCTVNIPYVWDNEKTGLQMGIAFKVEGWNSVQGYLGNTRQILEIIPIPANGTTTTVPVTTILR